MVHIKDEFANPLSSSYKFTATISLVCQKLNLRTSQVLDFLLYNRLKFRNISSDDFQKKSEIVKASFWEYYNKEEELFAFLNKKVTTKHFRTIRANTTDMAKLDKEIMNVVADVFKNMNFNE